MNAILKPRTPARPRGRTARAALLRDYMPAAQRAVVTAALHGEESAALGDRLDVLSATLRRMPALWETDGHGVRAIARLHWFAASADWWLVELDATGRQGFGLFDLGQGFGLELGYFSLPELLHAGAELDLHWQPVQVACISADRTAAGLLAPLQLAAGAGFDAPTRGPSLKLRGDYSNILPAGSVPSAAPSLPFAPADVMFVEAIESAAGELALAVFDGEAELLALWDGIERTLDRWPDLRTCLRAPTAGCLDGWPAPHTSTSAQARYDELTATPSSYKVISRWSADRGLDPREQYLATGPGLIWAGPAPSPPTEN